MHELAEFQRSLGLTASEVYSEDQMRDVEIPRRDVANRTHTRQRRAFRQTRARPSFNLRGVKRADICGPTIEKGPLQYAEQPMSSC